MTDEQTIRDALDSGSYGDVKAALAALDSLLARAEAAEYELARAERYYEEANERAEAAEGNAAEWKERLELTLDACPSCGGAGLREVPEREQCATCDGSGSVSAAWMYERVEAAEKDAEAVRRKMMSNAHNLDHAIEMREAALARAEAAEKEAERLRDKWEPDTDDPSPGFPSWEMLDKANDRWMASQARCATLEAALREIVAVKSDWRESSGFVRMQSIARAALAAAATQPPCDGCPEANVRCPDCIVPAEADAFERSLLRADIKAGNADAAEAQLQRIKRLEAEAQPAEEAVVAAASVLGLSREETDELVRLVRSEGATTPPAEKEGT